MSSNSGLGPDTRRSTVLDVNLTPQADADLLAIWLYTAETWSTNQADAYTDAIQNTFKLLAQSPNIGHARPELRLDIRTYPSAEHLIVYTATTDTLTIIRILGQRQNWRSILTD